MSNPREEPSDFEHLREPSEVEGLQTEEGVSGEDAADELTTSPDEKPSFPDAHPEEARRAREAMGEETPGD